MSVYNKNRFSYVRRGNTCLRHTKLFTRYHTYKDAKTWSPESRLCSFTSMPYALAWVSFWVDFIINAESPSFLGLQTIIYKPFLYHQNLSLIQWFKAYATGSPSTPTMYAVRLPTRTYIHTCGCRFERKVSHTSEDLTPVHLPYPCRACYYGQCFAAQARISAKYLDQLVKTRTSARISQGLQFRLGSTSSTRTTNSQRGREVEMLSEQSQIISAWQLEEKEIWKQYRKCWDSRPRQIFHTESFLQWDNPQILPQKEPDARYSTALVNAFDEGTIGLTGFSEVISSDDDREKEKKRMKSARIVEGWDGLRRNVRRDRWPPSPLD